jgi:hypothetical protein
LAFEDLTSTQLPPSLYTVNRYALSCILHDVHRILKQLMLNSLTTFLILIII